MSQRSQVQSILKVRRHYNQWVADQTLEDYALRFTARDGHKMSIGAVGRTALGATAFLALESIAAAVTLNYGFINAVSAIVVVCLIFFITGFPIAYHAAKNGLDIDLLTRGAGFGYLGSTLTSLIYATFTFIFFAIEAAILSSALHLLFGIPLPLAYVICAFAVIPIVVRGISAISKFQVGTQSLWLLLQVAALAVVFLNEWQQFDDWSQFTPSHLPEAQQFSWVYFGAAASVLFALMAQIGEQVDYLRFLPQKNPSNSKHWWFWLTLSGPGWVSVGLLKMLFGSFLAFVAIRQGVSALEAADPTAMYQRAFSYIIQSDQAALMLAALMVILSQMKINVTNAYAGSIAWSNFFSRLTHSHPGRVVWLVFNVALALLLMELGIHRALESVLSVFALLAVSWLGCLSADLMINKPLGLSPKRIEFKRGHLYDINPVGAFSMLIASGLGLAVYLGYFGEQFKTLSHFFSLAACFISVPMIAWLTKGKYYLARQPVLLGSDLVAAPCECSICNKSFERDDVLYCPAYRQNICSLCCSLDSRCLDQCKPDWTAQSRTYHWLKRMLKPSMATALFGRGSQFLIWFTLVNMVIASLLALVYRHIQLQTTQDLIVLESALWVVFFMLMIVSGVVTWLFLLSHDSRKVAQQESNRQTQKLIEEIDAHKETDSKLQQAKELAERANAAKSRYLSGISHELRTPLQSILGYTQLLSERDDTPSSHHPGLNTIHRSGQHLADLIEGLLDVSKIEAGRLDLHKTSVSFPELVEQIAQMFSMQAENKGISLQLLIHSHLPKRVKTDEKRLRQILINLLSNAIKYTEQGHVEFHVRYRNQVAEFQVIDTGSGIPLEEQERIFSPFERVKNEQTATIPGTGLGLTIVKLLVEIMGGDLQMRSTIGKGSSFTVSLMLPWIAEQQEYPLQTRVPIKGYTDDQKKILLVDDDPIVRGLLNDLLQPLGFKVFEAVSAEHCLTQLDQLHPDLFILDVNMPGINGLELCQLLRRKMYQEPIFMLSANAQEPTSELKQTMGFDDYLVKPIDNHRLLDKIGEVLELEWIYQSHTGPAKPRPAQRSEAPTFMLPESAEVRELISAAEVGYKRGVHNAINELLATQTITEHQATWLREKADAMQFQTLRSALNIGELC